MKTISTIKKSLLTIITLIITIFLSLALFTPTIHATNKEGADVGGSKTDSSKTTSGSTAGGSSATGDVCNSNAPASVIEAAGCNGNKNSLPAVIQIILNSIITICGIVAVIYVVVGGFQYMTSTGDPGKLQKARNTILYAAIGIIICALAFVIVNFVIMNLLGQGSKKAETSLILNSSIDALN